MSNSAPDEVRLYGNWRKPDAGRGVGGLGQIGTIIMVVGLGLTIVWATARGLIEGLIVGAVIASFLGLVVARDRYGKSLLTRVSERLGWWAARNAGGHLYRSGPLARIGYGRHQLPGVLAATELSECTDSYGRPFGLLGLAKGRYSVVIATSPDGASLVDSTQIDQWVAQFGAWLANLGDEPGLVAAMVTVESAPDSGTLLRSSVEARFDPDAPAFARDVMAEVIDRYPAGSQSVRAHVALTFDGEGVAADQFGRDVATRLPHLTRGLEASGAGATRVCTAADICRLVRIAYDPAAAPVMDEAVSNGDNPELTWGDVGPVSHQTGWDHYIHDSGVSVTWEMTDAPRGAVQAQVLARLLAPHRDVQRKRVSMLYRPVDAGRSAELVEKDLDAAEFRATAENRTTARQKVAVARAQKTAMEEASGAGLINFGMLVTATVPSDTGLAKARAAIDSLRATARIQLRPTYGAQDSAFAACLPLGLVLGDLLVLPTDVRTRL